MRLRRREKKKKNLCFVNYMQNNEFSIFPFYLLAVFHKRKDSLKRKQEGIVKPQNAAKIVRDMN